MMYPYLEVEEHSICVTFMFHVAPVVDVLIVKANVLVDDDLPFSKYTKREQKYFFLNIQRYFSGSLALVGIEFQDKSSVPNIKTFGLHIGSRESVRMLEWFSQEKTFYISSVLFIKKILLTHTTPCLKCTR